MQFGSKIKRNIITGSIFGLVPDVLIAWVASSMTQSGLVGFFAVLVGLQIVYLLVWARKAIWAWLLFWFFGGRKKMAAHLFDYLRSSQFPEPGDYQDDVDDYLGDVMNNKNVSVDVRLKAAVEVGTLNAFRMTGQGTLGLQTVLAFEDAIQRYKRSFPPSHDGGDHEVQADQSDGDGEDEEAKAAGWVKAKCEIAHMYVAGLTDSDPEMPLCLLLRPAARRDRKLIIR